MTDPQHDDDETPGLPPEIEQLLRNLTGGELDPQMAQMMQGMGLDKVDPQMLAMVMGQVQAMFSAPESDTAVNAVLATDIARKTVAAEGDELASAADGRAAAEAVQVAGMWLDAVTDVTSPGPHRRRLEPGRVGRGHDAGVDRPRRAGRRRGHRCRRHRPRGPARAARRARRPGEAGLPAGMLDQAGPMLRRMHGSMFSMQLGQGTGTLAREVLTGCEVSLPLVPAPTVVLMPAALREFARGPRGRRAPGPALPRGARGRPGAPVRGGAVARPGPARGGARLRGRHQHRHLGDRGGGRLDRPLRPRGGAAGAAGPDVRARSPPRPSRPPWPGSRPCSPSSRAGSTSSPTAPPATTCRRPTRSARPCAAAAPRVAPAEKAFGALVGLELRPRRLRDAANLFAALEDAGGPARP